MSLKKLSLLLLVAGLFVNSFAILLVVDEDGLGMDFATIGDALETAEKGDTIIITKKHTGDWHEDIVIDKGLTLITQDLTIKNWGTITINTEDTVIIDSLYNIGNLTYTDGTGGGVLLISDLLLTGNIVYFAKDKNGLMQISNSQIATISASAATAGGNVVRVLSSNSSSITVPANYKLELYNSRSGHISYADGDVIGNQINSIKVTTGGEEENTKIIGNHITSINGDKNSITFLPLDKNLKVLNNKFTPTTVSNTGKVYYSKINPKSVAYPNYYYHTNYFYNGSTTVKTDSVQRRNLTGSTVTYYDTVWTYSAGSGARIIDLSAGSYTGEITIEQNFFNSKVAGGYGLYATLSNEGKVLFNHNAFDNPSTPSSYNYMLSAPGGFVTANYNFADNASSSVYKLSGVTDQKGNNKNSVTYTDAGNPDPFYNDIDGTRCDIGNEGGAYPYSTFTRSGRIGDATLRKPLVMWVEAPRKIRPGQKIEIKATGIAF